MKRILKFFAISALALTTVSCDSYLDVNDNPNQATSTTAQQVLPNALAITASTIVSYNDYGSGVAGYAANAGGFGFTGSPYITYNYSTNNYTGLWSGVYDNITDYQYIIDNTKNDPAFAKYNAIAKIMKSHQMQMLVDQYGDAPYSEAWEGVNNLSPKYDKAEDIYKDLIVQLDSAVYIIDTFGDANNVGASDIMFAGDMEKWKRFANTLKLRMLVRVSNVGSLASFVNERFATFGSSPIFLTDDALVQPGYLISNGKLNPYWNTYHSNAAGTASGAGRQYIPSKFILSLYTSRISDPERGKVIYRSYPNTPSNQLGDQTDGIPTAPSGAIAWYTGTGTANSLGLFKGRTMGQPIILAAESYFLQAEARERGLLAGSAADAYKNGIISSFRYLYKDANGNVDATKNPTTDANAYIAANTDNTAGANGNNLVDYEKSTNKIETIITQKYIALNFIHGHEAWSEYRRTGYPSLTPTSTFVSVASQATSADRLPKRMIYPATEYQLNSANAPAAAPGFVFNNPIFWDIN
ncbi:SusD/RagB family nutrient-binding outer membrane lipoprotein [Pontibacter sp. H249]|uniref:SusD/RagB family nutrient-binding outer membrane lipoprotein n=1 Tax=Pontibacter sp. H249 TaxID=3133420 RepID=UPI0030BE4C53